MLKLKIGNATRTWNSVTKRNAKTGQLIERNQINQKYNNLSVKRKEKQTKKHKKRNVSKRERNELSEKERERERERERKRL